MTNNGAFLKAVSSRISRRVVVVLQKVRVALVLDGAQQRERAALRAHDGDAIQEGMQTFLGLRFRGW